ncbi:MAG TPA: sulfite exporter TauE/SafE family protein [Candidatus Dormibacteraeota bacterium]|nr:sulfite exporter TauE/SafE family protein [Candidatus Dormibacteraeota bacterium]
MRALLASPLGLLIGLSLGALGGGGSILAVPLLVYVAGEGARAATTTALVVVGAVSLGGAVAHWRAGRVRLGWGLLFSLAGSGGSVAGSLLNRTANPQWLLLAFAGLMLVAAWRMLAQQRAPAQLQPAMALAGGGGGPTGPTTLPTRDPLGALGGWGTVAKVAAVGSVVGFLTGFFGVGGGFVIVPGLVLALGFRMPEAIGTSLLVIAIDAAVALSTRLATAGIDWHVALPFTVAGLLGVSAGKRLADRLRPQTLVRGFASLLVLLAAYVALRSTLALVH